MTFTGWFDVSNNEYKDITIVQLSDDNLVLNASWAEVSPSMALGEYTTE